MKKGELLWRSTLDIDLIRKTKIIWGISTIGLSICAILLIYNYIFIDNTKLIESFLFGLVIINVMTLFYPILYSITELRIYENGITTPSDAILIGAILPKDFLRKKFIPFSKITRICLNKDGSVISIFYLGKNGEQRVDIWKKDISDLETFKNLLKDKVVMED